MPFFIVAVGAEKEESSGTSSVIAVQQRGVLLRSRGEEKVPPTATREGDSRGSHFTCSWRHNLAGKGQLRKTNKTTNTRGREEWEGANRREWVAQRIPLNVCYFVNCRLLPTWGLAQTGASCYLSLHSFGEEPVLSVAWPVCVCVTPVCVGSLLSCDCVFGDPQSEFDVRFEWRGDFSRRFQGNFAGGFLSCVLSLLSTSLQVHTATNLVASRRDSGWNSDHGWEWFRERGVCAFPPPSPACPARGCGLRWAEQGDDGEVVWLQRQRRQLQLSAARREASHWYGSKNRTGETFSGTVSVQGQTRWLLAWVCVCVRPSVSDKHPPRAVLRFACDHRYVKIRFFWMMTDEGRLWLFSHSCKVHTQEKQNKNNKQTERGGVTFPNLSAKRLVHSYSPTPTTSPCQ